MIKLSVTTPLHHFVIECYSLRRAARLGASWLMSWQGPVLTTDWDFAKDIAIERLLTYSSAYANGATAVILHDKC